MALAQASDVVAALGRPLDDDETARVDVLLDEASDLVSAWVGHDFAGDAQTPGDVVRVVARMAARVLDRGGGLPVGVSTVQATIGPLSQSVGIDPAASGGGPWLSASDKTILARYRGLRIVRLTSAQTGKYRRAPSVEDLV